MKKFLILLPSVLLSFTSILAQPAARLNIHYTSRDGLAISIQHALHVEYGFEYPITYMIGLPAGSHDLGAYIRYSDADSWKPIAVKTDTDIFNGIEAVRFDYVDNIAYVSAAIGADGDSLFLNIRNNSGSSVVPQFEGISKYYDNRQAAVTVTADDWSDWTVGSGWFSPLIDLFRSYGLYVTVGVITQSTSSSSWQALQIQLDSGYVEAASHSRTHSYVPYADPVGEVEGSRDDILSNVSLPSPFGSGTTGFVYTWIAPYGEYDSTVDSLLGQFGYLDARLYSNLDTTNPREYIYGDSTLHSWNASRNHFQPFLPTVELGAPSWGGGDTSLVSLNSLFDSIVAKGGVYHLMWHPQVVYADIGKRYLLDHLSHISRRTNIWYANLGAVYLYHMIQGQNASPLDQVAEQAGSPRSYELFQNYPNPFNPGTEISYRLSVGGHIVLKVYDVLGRVVATLADGYQSAGDHSIRFDGSRFASGIYLCRLDAGTFTAITKMLLMK